MFAVACASTAQQLSWQEFAKPKMAVQLVDARQKHRDGWKKVPFFQPGTFTRCFRVPGICIYIYTHKLVRFESSNLGKVI